MTTIAYKDGIIAYDSQLTRDGVIMSTTCDKKRTYKGVTFFCTGFLGDFDDFAKAYFGETRPDTVPELTCFVVDKGVAYRAACNEENVFWKERACNPDAIGSGASFALAAMDMGASAKEAVVLAAKRDVNTGGRIRTWGAHGWNS